MYSEAEKIQSVLDEAQRIIILQADNPDGDSLGSALALEQILGDLGKEPILYCGIDMPAYLHYLKGWDRVQKDLPTQFDTSIIVDASTMSLFDKLEQAGQRGWVASKPCIVLDHHGTVNDKITFATAEIIDATASSTGGLIYALAKQLNWPLSISAQEFLMTAILGDTQGLTNQLATPGTYRAMAEMLEAGVDRPKLEDIRREFSKMPQTIFKYKARLIERTEFYADNRLALVEIPQAEINEFSPLYNPAPLIQGDMLQTSGVSVAVVLKRYDDGRITAAIRCNPGFGIGARLAEAFGGGGHPFASGFKITDGRSFDQIKTACISKATELLDHLEQPA